MEHFIGVDLSLTGTGVSMIDKDGDFLEDKLIKTTAHQFKTTEARHCYIAETLQLFIQGLEQGGNDRVDILMGIEGLSFGSRGSRLAQISGLHYVVRQLLWSKRYNYIIVPPTTVKKFVSGKGNAPKEMMLMKVYKKWGLEFSDNNLCDAFCIAKYTMDLHNRTPKKSKNLRIRKR